MRKTVLIGMLVLAAGCGVNSQFIYKAGAPAAEGVKHQVKVAVLPFKDGTEDFTKRGSVFDPKSLMYNLAKSGISGSITALTPELWAKSLADEMAASGAFRSVRFIYSPSELADEEFFIEGTVEKAYASGAWTTPNEFALALRALRKADKRLIWEKTVTRVWKNQPSLYDGCGIGIQCMVDRSHAYTNQVMQGMFAEAVADFAASVGALSRVGIEGGGQRGVPAAAGESTRPETSRPAARDSVEQTIRSILEGK
ncbi:MAG: hypothetical protein HY896_04395 [Deltaproteobacteria bacterium]|nr:hypothetical protein [Deltaproteobacteria bacterium]